MKNYAQVENCTYVVTEHEIQQSQLYTVNDYAHAELLQFLHSCNAPLTAFDELNKVLNKIHCQGYDFGDKQPTRRTFVDRLSRCYPCDVPKKIEVLLENYNWEIGRERMEISKIS